MLRHFSLGPVLSSRVDEARATEPLERSRWQQGMVLAAQAFEQPRSGYGALQVFLGAGVGVVVGTELTRVPLFVQFVIGGFAGLVVYWGVPTIWAVVGWWRAPIAQRDQARTYARALEEHVRAYAQWAARREIAYQFRQATLEDVRRISQDPPVLMGTLADEEERRRINLTQTCQQITDNGTDQSVFLQGQLAALDDPDGTWSDDIARIRNSMLSACQNLLSDLVSQPPPAAPTPPKPELTGAFQI